jgi:hypothetical protein
MMRIMALIIISTLALNAQKRGRVKPPKKVVREAAPEILPQGDTGPVDTEMAAIRAVQVRGKATYADTCRIILLQRSEFSRFKTDGERCDHLANEGIIDTAGIDIYRTPVSLGAAVKSAIYAHGLEQGLMLKLTGWSWYALLTGESLGLIPEGMSAGDTISGSELVQIMDEALLQADTRRTWNEDENPYREFGYETYEEMYENPSGPGRVNPAKP